MGRADSAWQPRLGEGELRDLGHGVHDILTSVGLPATYDPDLPVRPDVVPGAEIYIATEPEGVIGVRWNVGTDLRLRSMGAFEARDFTNAALRLKVEAVSVMGEGIARILAAAGYTTGVGIDFAEDDVWVRPCAQA